MIATLACVILAKSLILDKIHYYSQELGAYEGMVTYIVENESQFNNCAVGDTHITGKDKPSLGLVQINMLYNASTSPEEALDPDYAIKYLINDLREGNWRKWTTARKFHDLYPNHPYFKT